MKSHAARYISVLMILFTAIQCKHNNNAISDLGIDSIDLTEPVPMEYFYDTAGVGLPIFYNMYLSVELSSLFQSSGAVYNQSMLNPHEQVTEYITSSKKALNLGVFAVDLSYARVFEQLDMAANYFNAMQRMAEELGISSNYFENTAERFERNINNRDSLIKIANEVYMATDAYLKENERYGAAAQVIIGGWVEAVYIACNVAVDTKDIEIIDRLAEQNYSLVNLLEMLNNYREDAMIEFYINELSSLQPPFSMLVDRIQANFESGIMEGEKEIQSYVAAINELNRAVSRIRNEIVAR